MAIYGYAITSKGSNLLSKLMASGASLEPTRCQFGSGRSTATSVSGLVSQTALITPIGNGEMDAPIYSSGQFFVNIQYRNSLNGGISSNTNLNEYGIFANDPDDGEILFIYGSLGDTPEILLPYNGSIAITRKFQICATVGSITGVTGNFDSIGNYIVSSTSPEDTTLIWIDSGHNYLAKFWNGSSWIAATTSIPVLSSDPSSPENGQMWVKS